MNSSFDGDDVHRATSIHLQSDVRAMLVSLPENATIYVQKNELDPVGATNNLRGLAAKSSSFVEMYHRTTQLSRKRSMEEKVKPHKKISYYGRTFSWKDTGYLLTDGSILDFSGQYEGASGGYRTVDHRDILDIYPEETEMDGNSAMVDSMSQGNIRIMPEGNGINL